MKLFTPCSLGYREVNSDMCEPLVSGHTDHALSNSTDSAASASSAGVVGRYAPYAPTRSARSVSSEITITLRRDDGRGAGLTIVGSAHTGVTIARPSPTGRARKART